VIACLFRLMPRQLASFMCALLLIIGLEVLSPAPLKLHFWLHKRDYLARIAATQPSSNGRLSMILYQFISHIPTRDCPQHIVYDNSNDIDLIARTDTLYESDARFTAVRKIDENFYLRYPPCGF
jgi:hypothetical protein